MSVYVSIGRNVKGKPMGELQWSWFRQSTRRAVDRFAGPVVSETVGKGLYDGETEDTAVFVGEVNPRGNLLKAFRERLSHLAEDFGQESIALAVADVAFVTAGEAQVCDDPVCEHIVGS